MANANTIGTIVWVLISVFIFTPLAVLFQSRFKRQSHMIMIKKRHPVILNINGIFMCLWFFIAFPFTIINFSGIIQNNTFREIFDRIDYILMPTIGMGLYLTTAWRFWHMFYDLKHAKAIQTSFSGFQHHLDPEAVNNPKANKNFWLTHKKKLGSEKWMKKRVAIYYIITFSISIISYQILFNTYLWLAHMIAIVTCSISNVTALFLAFKVPHKFSDHFFIKHEMKIIFSCLLTGLIFGLIGVSLNVLIINNKEYQRMMLVWVTSFADLFAFIVFMISFYYIPKRILSAEHQLKEFQKQNEELREAEAVQEEANKTTEIIPEILIQLDDVSITSKYDTPVNYNTPVNDTPVSVNYVKENDPTLISNPSAEEEKDHIDPLPRLTSIPEKRTTIHDAQDDLIQFVRRISISKNETDAIIEMRRHSFQTKGNDKKRHSVELYDILLNDIGFKQFMDSLAKDLSTECLLCFVEIVQFKFLMKQRFDIVKPGAIPIDMGFSDQYPLYGIVPMSEINRNGFRGLDLEKYSKDNTDHESDLMISCKKIIHRIYKKYIRTGAELKVNIPNEMRHSLKVKVGNEHILLEKLNITASALFTMYDEVAAAMLKTMEGFPTFQTACNALGDGKDDNDNDDSDASDELL